MVPPGVSSRVDVAVLMAAAIALHAPVFFGAHLGEQDTARLVNDALLWQKGGVRQVALSDYQYVISPFCLAALTTCLFAVSGARTSGRAALSLHPIGRRGQFGVGRSAPSITSTSIGPVVGSSFRPSCSSTAVNSDGASGSTPAGRVPPCPAIRSGVHVSSRS